MQGQGADVHELAGLVDRLVGHEQDLAIGLHLHIALELFLTERGLRLHFQRVLPRFDAWELEIGRRMPIRISRQDVASRSPNLGTQLALLEQVHARASFRRYRITVAVRAIQHKPRRLS